MGITDGTQTPDYFQPSLQPVNWPREKYRPEYESLVRHINSGEPHMLFIGAGISKAIYGDWADLVYAVSNAVGVKLSEDEKSNPKSYALEILEKCKQSSETDYFSELRRRFNPEGRISFLPLHLRLLRLPVVGFITTNIDACLMRAAQSVQSEMKPKHFYYYPDALRITQAMNRNLFHIHGVARNHVNEDTIEYAVLAKSDYDRAYTNNVKDFLAAIFREISVIFVGFSLDDPEIQKALEASKQYQDGLRELACTRTTLDVNHYIFLSALYEKDTQAQTSKPNHSREDELNQVLRGMNVRAIRYNALIRGEHTELERIINNLEIETREQAIGG